LVFTPELVALLLQTTIEAGTLRLMEANCAQLTSFQFREVLLHFSPSSLILEECRLRECQISDEFVRGFIEK
ncbi:hypothetical protein AAVH_42451, partial [Aphelenchoides avenae]